MRQRVAVRYQFESLAREEPDPYLAHQLKAAGVTGPMFDDTARQAVYQTTKGILRKVNKPPLTALRQATSRKTPRFELAERPGTLAVPVARRLPLANGVPAVGRTRIFCQVNFVGLPEMAVTV